jgi:hypothetical protein
VTRREWVDRALAAAVRQQGPEIPDSIAADIAEIFLAAERVRPPQRKANTAKN